MTIQIEKGNVRLSSGRVLYAHGGVLGLRFDSFGAGHPQNAFRLTAGWHDMMECDRAFPDEDEVQLTVEERQEIAEFMATLWRRWGDAPPSAG